jgi:simple sugar transport system permease protein
VINPSSRWRCRRWWSLVGENPLRALRLLATGAFGSGEAIGYTLYYATSFAFTGLAVAVAFHGSLFNIGAEGQAYLGGLGVSLLCLGAGGWPTALVIPVAVAAAAVFGGAWAFVPAWLQARRGSHVVITTIMFNFIAAALMTYLLVNLLIKPGQQSPETREFAPRVVPQLHDSARASAGRSAARRSISRCPGAGGRRPRLAYLWHTRWGYELRAEPQRDGRDLRRTSATRTVTWPCRFGRAGRPHELERGHGRTASLP